MKAEKANKKIIKDLNNDYSFKNISNYIDGKSKLLSNPTLEYLINNSEELNKYITDYKLTYCDLRYFLTKKIIPYQKFCVVCKKQIHIDPHYPGKGFANTCSKACMYKDPARNRKISKVSSDPNIIAAKQLKTTKTNMQRYGCKAPSQNEEVKEKMIKTNIQRYGCKAPSQNEEVKEKMYQTCLEKYGTKYTLQYPEFKERQKQTMLKRYGVRTMSQIPNLLKNTFKKKYNVENPMHLPENVVKARNTLLKKYGKENVSQVEEIKQQKATTHAKTIVDKLINLCKDKEVEPCFTYEDYAKIRAEESYKYAAYFPWHCKKCGNNFKAVYVNGQIPVCRNCYPRYISEEQKAIIKFIKDNITVNIIENTKDIIPPLELDIYIPDIKLAIEVNGDYWHSIKQRPDPNYHLNKTKLCEEKGIKLIHIFESEWKQKTEAIKKILKENLDKKLDFTKFSNSKTLVLDKRFYSILDFSNDTFQLIKELPPKQLNFKDNICYDCGKMVIEKK